MLSFVLKNVRFGQLCGVGTIQTSKREFAKSNKSGQSRTRLLVKAVFVVELGLFIGSYLVWKRMNSSQDFRFYMRNNYPQVLEGYYKMGESLGNVDTRTYDLTEWKKQGKL